MFVDPYMANITIFGGNFAPQGWLFCDGSLLDIAQYDALYALIGTTYGGDGNITFALPDLRGRVAVHAGQAPGMSLYTIGQQGGMESVSMNAAQLPPHTHLYGGITGGPGASSVAGTVDDPTNAVPAATGTIATYNSTGSGAMAAIANGATTPTSGGTLPVQTISPYQVMNYIICVEGIFPSRN